MLEYLTLAWNVVGLALRLIGAAFLLLTLAYGKAMTGRRLGNAVLLAESRVTVVDASLAGAVLIGLLLNAFFGWWWADPLAGAVIAVFAVREGLAHWREGSELPLARPIS